MSGPAPGAPTVPAPARPCVLVVEDEPDLRLVIDLVLGRDRYDIRRTADLAGARAALAAGLLPELVILDLLLPDGDGLDLLRELKGRVPAPVVLVLTGLVGARAAAAQAGADEFMTKPFDPCDLETAVERLLRRA